MNKTTPLAEHLAPDTIRQLEQAAKKRYDDARELLAEKRFLMAVYLYGFSAEMCLAAAYFRSAGFGVLDKIDDDIRREHMKFARSKSSHGKPLMDKDPHPLVGWARFLHWSRNQRSTGELTPQDHQRLNEAIQNALEIYRHWRPKLRYKLTHVNVDQVDEVRKAAKWFIENQGRL